jgi:hypothetical protein
MAHLTRFLIPPLAIGLGRVFFIPSLNWVLTDEKVEAFERVINSTLGNVSMKPITYHCIYPKWEFLQYCVERKDIILHGSNRRGIGIFEPQEQVDYSGRQVMAVFGTMDSIWAIFFAVLNKSAYRGSLRNACWIVEKSHRRQERFYFFSLNREMLNRGAWIDGVVYLMPKETFSPVSNEYVRFDEWLSHEPVRALAQLEVSPDDFPMIKKVAGHGEGERMIFTWLAYKWRIRGHES